MSDCRSYLTEPQHGQQCLMPLEPVRVSIPNTSKAGTIAAQKL